MPTPAFELVEPIAKDRRYIPVDPADPKSAAKRETTADPDKVGATLVPRPPWQVSLLSPIFPGRLDPGTVRQKGVNNCPLPALLAAMAHARPELLHRMIETETLARPKTCWFFEGKPPEQGTFMVDQIVRVRFQHRAIEMSPFLMVDQAQDGPRRFIPRFAHATDGSSWVSYIEKAYVIFRCGHVYENLNFLGGAIPLSVERVLEDVAVDFDRLTIQIDSAPGERLRLSGATMRDLEPVSFDPPPGQEADEGFTSTRFADHRNAAAVRTAARAMLRRVNTHPTIATTAFHTVAVIGWDGRSVTVHDALETRRATPMRLDEFLRRHDGLYQVRPDNGRRTHRP